MQGGWRAAKKGLMTEILQTHIPYDAFAEVALPGISPMKMTDWLIIDEAYAGQMALREELLARRCGDVLALDEHACAAAAELLDVILELLEEKEGFLVSGTVVTCPDGRKVTLDGQDPLGSVARLVQEDICILQRQGDQHVLTGAVLCFPASWSLSEKFGKPLTGIHVPVDSYDDNIARRVQRLFDGVRVERPMWRKNLLWYNNPDLFQPRSENERRTPVDKSSAPYLRSERQSILRLPRSEAVVFSIHTFVVARENVATE